MIIFYTPEARDDLQRHRAFIAEKIPAAAQQIAADLLAGITMLKELPYLGRKVEKAPTQPGNNARFISKLVHCALSNSWRRNPHS